MLILLGDSTIYYMKIISLNTWGCRKAEALFEYIGDNKQSTDVFCFQEILRGGTGLTDKEELKDCYNDIQTLLPDHEGYFFGYGEEGYYYDKRKDEVDFEFGIASFVRKTLSPECKEGRHLCDYAREWNDYDGHFAAGACMVVAADTYTIVNVHGMWQGSIKKDTEAKLEQSKQILELTQKYEGKKIIVGDFNLLPETHSLQMFQDYYIDLVQKYDIQDTRGALYLKDLRFSDYAFVDKGIEIQSFSVPNLPLSDHLPLVIEFE